MHKRCFSIGQISTNTHLVPYFNEFFLYRQSPLSSFGWIKAKITTSKYKQTRNLLVTCKVFFSIVVIMIRFLDGVLFCLLNTRKWMDFMYMLEHSQMQYAAKYITSGQHYYVAWCTRNKHILYSVLRQS